MSPGLRRARVGWAKRSVPTRDDRVIHLAAARVGTLRFAHPTAPRTSHAPL